ncbi:NmrA domain-containing protein [Favolaschia claudopus]|uniref:NmrA domain-containing protein n=1 Tax=Favolaschia claudopus TaxID=2862362 RepID=A0AAW0CUI1_9AGAR
MFRFLLSLYIQTIQFSVPSDRMSTYKSFALVGGGTIGLPIVNALAATKVPVILLSRSSEAKAVPSNVQVIKVDYDNADAIAKVLKEHNVDVVVSTLTTMAAAAQKTVVDASKLAGIKLFVPSEFGLPTEGYTEGPLGDKAHIAKYLTSVGIPSTRIFTGSFVQLIPWLLGGNGKAQIIGKGDTPFSTTSIPDIAGFVAHILTTLPPSELENRIFRLEGERVTMNGLAAQFKATPEYVDKLTDRGEHEGFLNFLVSAIEDGKASTGWNGVKEGTGADAAGTGNAAWPGHHWQTVKEVHNL